MANGYFQNPIRINANMPLNANMPKRGLLAPSVNSQSSNLSVSPLSSYSSLLAPPAATPAVSPLAASVQDRANAFLKGLGQLGSGLIMAGAPTTDPSQFARGIAQGGQGFGQAFDQSLNQSRQRNVQDLNLQMAQATQRMAATKAAREALTQQGLDNLAVQLGYPRGTPEAVLQAHINNLNKGKLNANQLVTQESALITKFENAIKPHQQKIDAFSGLEAIFIDPSKAPSALLGEGVAPRKALYKYDTGKKDENDKPIYETIDASTLQGTGFQDIALIFAFMKALDPTSVVREGEFTMAAGGGGKFAQAKNYIKSILSGQKLRPEDRRAILGVARGQFLEANRRVDEITQSIKNRAKNYEFLGMDPNRITALPRYKPRIKFTQTLLPFIPKSNNASTVTSTNNKKKRLRPDLKPRISSNSGD